MRDLFVHIHIPKCGGTTVADFLKRNFGTRLLLTSSVLNDYQYDAVQVEKIINHHPDVECISGHKLSTDLPYYRTDWNIVAFSWVRDPVERFISHYFFHRNHTTLVPEAKQLSLVEYTKWALVEGNQPNYINGQTKFLSGSNGDFDRINTLIHERKLLVYPLKNLQLSLHDLANRYPASFHEVSIDSKNRSERDQAVPEDFSKLVEPFVEQDIKLLELAKAITSNTITTGHKMLPFHQRAKRTFGFELSKLLRGTANTVERILLD